MKNCKGLGRVFSFTFRRQTGQTGYRALTLTVAVLCFVIPALVLTIMAVRENHRAVAPEPDDLPEEVWQIPECRAVSILAHDETENPITDWSFLRDLHPESWDMGYTHDEVSNYTIVLKLQRGESGYEAHVSLPEGTSLTEEDLAAYEMFLWENFPAILEVKSGLTAQQQALLAAPIEVAPRETPQLDPLADLREVLGMILPYLCVMLTYFLILFYGQGVSNSVVLEKSSKLMDLFLVSVEPVAMVLGKVLAIAAAGLMQLGLWLIALVGGFAVGAAACRAIAPEAEFAVLMLWDALSLFEGMFSLTAVALAVGIMVGGFLIYCALAGVGGALAGKAEDLSSTNVLFSMALVASFLSCLLSGGGDGIISDAAWLDFVPFTAILVTPARVLLGDVSLGMGAVTLVIVLLTAAVLCVLAGKIYRMMSLYKGNPPSIRQMFAMLKENK